MPTEPMLESFIALDENNAHAEAIERFYAEDASMQENFDPPRWGRDTLVAGESAFLKLWQKVESRCVRPAFCANDRTIIRGTFEFTAPDGSKRTMDELACQRWQGDKIVEERFYYDPKQIKG